MVDKPGTTPQAPPPMGVVRLANDKVASVASLRAGEDFNRLKRIAQEAHASGLFPKKVKSWQGALIIMLTGQELGIGAMASLRTIAVFDGNAVLAADLMVAKVKQTGDAHFSYERDIDGGSCTLTLTRRAKRTLGGLAKGPGIDEVYTCTWDRERVARSRVNQGRDGIKRNWECHEPEMLKHRCDAEACRAQFPDVLLGCYTPDEAMDFGPIEVVELPASRTETVKKALGVPTEAPPEDAPDEPPDTPDDAPSVEPPASPSALSRIEELYAGEPAFIDGVLTIAGSCIETVRAMSPEDQEDALEQITFALDERD